MREHKFIEHENCNVAYCSICEGGLSICEICGCWEGSLPTECPGKQVTEIFQKSIYNGVLDFRDGRWVRSPSIHSPERYRALRDIDADSEFSTVKNEGAIVNDPWVQGFMAACAITLRNHDNTVAVRDTYACQNMSIEQLRAAGVDESDIEVLTPIIQELRARRLRDLDAERY